MTITDSWWFPQYDNKIYAKMLHKLAVFPLSLFDVIANLPHRDSLSIQSRRSTELSELYFESGYESMISDFHAIT